MLLSVRALLDRFAEVAPPILADAFSSPRWCLNGTRVTISVLRALRLHAVALSVDAIAMNPTFARLLEQFGGVPENDQQAFEWSQAGAYSVMIDTVHKQTPDDWAGHLVTLVNNEFLVDASAIQFRREDENLLPPPVIVTEISRRFRMGESGTQVALPLGGRLIYHARLTDQSYQAMPGFQATELHRLIAENIRKVMS